eukprot:COSAG01_NODE_365_length_18082_cov_9.136518_1_plen_142_part_00
MGACPTTVGSRIPIIGVRGHRGGADRFGRLPAAFQRRHVLPRRLQPTPLGCELLPRLCTPLSIQLFRGLRRRLRFCWAPWEGSSCCPSSPEPPAPSPSPPPLVSSVQYVYGCVHVFQTKRTVLDLASTESSPMRMREKSAI